jgi:hypothetical protein
MAASAVPILLSPLAAGAAGALSAAQSQAGLVDGFQVEEPQPLPSLPDSIELFGSEVCRFDSLEFVRVLYRRFKDAVNESGFTGPVTRQAALFGLREAMPAPKYLETGLATSGLLAGGTGAALKSPLEKGNLLPAVAAPHAQGGSRRASSIPSAATAPTMDSITTPPQTALPAPPSTTLFSVRTILAKALGYPMQDILDADFGVFALTDSYLDLLSLAVSSGMTDIQLQQLLLVFRDTHADITWMDSDSDLTTVTDALVVRLARLSNPRESAVVETKVEKLTVMEERIDPVALAHFEAAKKDAKGKKAQQMTDANLPRIQVPVEVQRETKKGVVVVKPPVFSEEAILDILDFFQISLFQHWRLFKFVLTQPRAVHTTTLNLFVEDPALFLTPLSEAITMEEYEQRAQRNELFAQYEKAATEAFAAATAEIQHQADILFAAEGKMLRAAYDKMQEEDRAAKMSVDEYKRTVDVLVRRVAKAQKASENSAQNGSASVADVDAIGTDWYAAIGKRLTKIEDTLRARLETQPSPTAAAGKKK